jgi:hypothetical protein
MSVGWLCSKNRKRHQRAMNKLMRDLNKNIENDNLWQGRFYVKQTAAQWREYEDKSGAELWVVLSFIDKKTGITYETAETVNHWRMWNGSHLWWKMNDFIVEKVKVWDENPAPNTDEWFANINW